MFNKKIAKSEDAALALNAALRLLTRREYSLYELKVKLLPRFTGDAVKTALTKCVNEGWQSEKRCAHMLVRHCVLSYYGPMKLNLLAKQKHIDLCLIENAIEEEETDWVQTALAALHKKYSTGDLLDYDKKQKALSFLYRRGFTTSQCVGALKLFGSVPPDNV